MKLNDPFNTPLYKQSLHNITKSKRLIYIHIYRTITGTEAIHKTTAVNTREENITLFYQNTRDLPFSSAVLGERKRSLLWSGTFYILGAKLDGFSHAPATLSVRIIPCLYLKAKLKLLVMKTSQMI